MNKGYNACADPEGGGGIGNHKLYKGFYRNQHLDPPPPFLEKVGPHGK